MSKPKQSNAGRNEVVPTCFTTEKLTDMKAKRTQDALAVAIEGRVLQIEEQEKAGFAEIGMLCFYVREWRLWPDCTDAEGEKCHSFESFMANGKNGSRSNRYAALKAYESLRGDVSLDDMKAMPRCNVVELSKVPKQHRTPEVKRVAKLLDGEAFTGYVEREIPEAHAESKKPLTLKFSRSQRVVIDKAIARAKEREEVSTNEEAVESICANMMLVWDEEDRLQARGAHA